MPITSNDNEINLLDLDSEPVIVAPPAVLNYNLPPTLPHPHEHLTKLQANLRAQLQLEQMQRDMLSFSFASPESRHGSIVTSELSIEYSVRILIEHQHPSPPIVRLANYESETMTSETVGIKISPSYAPSEFDSRMATRESVFTHIYKGSGTISAKGFLKTTQTFGIAELHVLGLQKFSLLSTEETTVKLSVLFFPEPNIKRVTLPYITRIVASLEIRTFISPTKRMENYPDADGAQTETIPIFDEPVGDSGWTKLPTPPQLSRDVLLYGAAHTVPLKELVAHRNELVPSFLSCYGCREYELVVSVSFNPTKVITVRVPLAVVVQNEPKTFLPFAAYD
ncbi:hypothetical protein DV495_002931 [Geotrichum candidum]|nr:hypothetical protein DV454_004704 [Geotrichum candidum]KAI9213398.1 hypothetical protein DS838_001737 [Geotrichum bryndzae]KAF5119329.1 hypothetical protein DV452_001748 [Geotrichum candidum]KAF5128787.1 hypothetical protein DV495_002931 [Geotrichum candidum]KAF7498124.1 hypothetical protein DV113_003837 [Geotrichum candidum]